MRKREEILRSEAEFHDHQMFESDRKREAEFYSSPDYERVNQKQIECVGEISGRSVLDYGSGPGQWTRRWLKKGANVTAIDISPESIKTLEKRMADEGIDKNLATFVMDAAHTTFEDNFFDVVSGGSILHHMVDFEGSIKEILRITKMGGYCVFSEPLGNNPIINLYRKLTPKARTVDEQPLTVENLKTIQRLNPDCEMYFFCLFTLISKLFSVLKLKRLSQAVLKRMMNLDDKVLNRKPGKITFWDKNAWFVVIKMNKK